jgi:ATP-dependent Lhr-like helicase
VTVDGFSRLAPSIQRALWQMGWSNLRPIQASAIEVLLDSERDLVISARTASGKTEAAFLPILSLISQAPAASVRAIYVGPLKALINDQFRRLEVLCQHTEISVHRWHGDVAGDLKRRLIDQPSGVLLITPESLESLFVNHTGSLKRLFHSLSFVVIDELHALHGTERGTHLRSLLHRLEPIALAHFRLVALSATLGDPSASREWLRYREPERVVVIDDHNATKTVRFGIFGYRRPIGHVTEAEDSEAEDAAPPPQVTEQLYATFRDSKNLIFANSRADVEWYGDQLNVHAKEAGRPGQFLVHHGSLNRTIREQTEELMQGRVPYTTVCSSSLELGIDIGNVAAVGQIGCPWGVSSLVQRLGRSGRGEDEPQCMRVYIVEDESSPDMHLCDRLYSELLQVVALAELMRQRWVEPPAENSFDYSTLVQQILSVLTETGGAPAEQLFDRLVRRGAFRSVDQSIFTKILRSIAKHDLIEQTSRGDLILGLEGERVVNHYDFYSAFATPAEYDVIYAGTSLGSLPLRYLPTVGEQLIFSARRWQVTEIDHRRGRIWLVPAQGRKKPKFQGSAGEIHARVRETMREALLGEWAAPYLNSEGTQMLADARRSAREAGLHQSNLVQSSADATLWFTWTSTQAHRTLGLMMGVLGLSRTDRSLAWEVKCARKELVDALDKLLSAAPEAGSLARLIEPKCRRKYDSYLTDEILITSLAAEAIDASAALDVIRNVR